MSPESWTLELVLGGSEEVMEWLVHRPGLCYVEKTRNSPDSCVQVAGKVPFRKDLCNFSSWGMSSWGVCSRPLKSWRREKSGEMAFMSLVEVCKMETLKRFLSSNNLITEKPRSLQARGSRTRDKLRAAHNGWQRKVAWEADLRQRLCNSFHSMWKFISCSDVKCKCIPL